MAEAFAKYINDLGLKDASGNTLTLEESENGIYQAGTYYEYLKGVVENSLNNFLEDTTFPYTIETKKGPQGGGRGQGGKKPDGAPQDENGGHKPDGASTDGNRVPQDGKMADGQNDGKTDQNMTEENKAGDVPAEAVPENNGKSLPEKSPEGKVAADGATPDTGNGTPDFYAMDGVDRNLSTGGVTLSGTYETAQDYIDALNADGTWVNYDSATNTATITSIADFNSQCKAIAGDNWGDTQEATLTFENAEGGKKGIYTEDKDLCFAVSLWGSQALFEANDNTLFNMEYVESQMITTPDQVLQNDRVTISVNGTETVYKYEEDLSNDSVITAEGLFEGSVPTTATTTAPTTTAATTVATTTTTAAAEDSNPATGEDTALLLLCAGLAAMSLVSIVCVRRLSYKK